MQGGPQRPQIGTVFITGLWCNQHSRSKMEGGHPEKVPSYLYMLWNSQWHVCVPFEQKRNSYWLAIHVQRNCSLCVDADPDELHVPAPIFPFVWQAFVCNQCLGFHSYGPHLFRRLVLFSTNFHQDHQKPTKWLDEPLKMEAEGSKPLIVWLFPPFLCSCGPLALRPTVHLLQRIIVVSIVGNPKIEWHLQLLIWMGDTCQRPNPKRCSEQVCVCVHRSRKCKASICSS